LNDLTNNEKAEIKAMVTTEENLKTVKKLKKNVKE
jgi:hypothetical protein